MTLSAPPPDSDDITNVIRTEPILLHQGVYRIHSLILPDKSQHRILSLWFHNPPELFSLLMNCSLEF